MRGGRGGGWGGVGGGGEGLKEEQGKRRNNGALISKTKRQDTELQCCLFIT